MARTVYNNHFRYLDVYMRPYPDRYFTGDGCIRDKDGYYFITGRVDDVMNVSGHRLGSAEVESALVGHEYCAEAAVIGIPHDIKGTGICAYVTPVNSAVSGVSEEEMITALKNAVRVAIGPIATPDMIVITPGLPKTRSGKIMRRLLRKIATLETESLGDISTLADPSIVEKLIEKVTGLLKKSKK
jgi:acetyl-CoA synthetase